MNKIAVIYSSLTGNTQKVAEAIHANLPIRSDILPIDFAKDLSSYELLFIGYWVDKSTADAKTIKLLQKVHCKHVALFATLGACPDTAYAQKCLNNAAAELPKDSQLVKTFICQGKIDPRLTEKFKDFPPEHPHAMTPERAARHLAAASHPDDKDLKAAGAFAKEVLKIFQSLGVKK